MIVKFLTYLRERPVFLKWFLVSILAFSVVYDLFVDRHHAEFWGDHLLSAAWQ